MVTDFISEPLEVERRILGDVADVVALNATNDEELRDQVAEADALMIYHLIKLSAATIERLRHCRLIVRCGVGFDNVDGRAARARGIPLANVPDYGTEEVADSAIGLTLSLTRGINLHNSRLREGRGPWSYTPSQPIWRLRGRTFGIVGLGRIGTAAALRAKALGMNVLFYDPYVPDGRDKALGVRRVETFDELLRQTHVLSLHCPLTNETRQMVDAEALAKLPRGAFVVNTARGGVADPQAVVDALASGHLTGAALDVLPQEPPAEDDPVIRAWRDPSHPAHDRLIINPHTAFYSEEGHDDMRVKGSENCRRVLLGEAPRNVVN
jgi:D-3-phosphoglycerate dehydrogenase/C-terminal binding protein